jgi:hypothetical protein
MKSIIKNSVVVDPFSFGGGSGTSTEYWLFGSNNQYPYALAEMSRGVPLHRRILNDKRNYIAGKGLTTDNPILEEYIKRVNKYNESLWAVINKVIYDYNLTGNGYLEVVTNRKKGFTAFFHQDSTKCRLAKDKKHILLHHDWSKFSKTEAKELPIFPLWEDIDGYIRTIIVIKDYEPMFDNYGIPDYIAGMNVSAIAYKTDKWNISRLDNSFQLSGVLELDSDTTDEDEAKELAHKIEQKYAGKPGQLLVCVKNMIEKNRGTTFTPIASSNEGDWISLHDQSNSDIIIAHSWFRELSGIDYTTGFSSERIMYAYQLAMDTLISPIQNKVLEPIKMVLKMFGMNGELNFINKPPITLKPSYMKIWEARKADGLDYDENDVEQNKYLANINNGTSNNK